MIFARLSDWNRYAPTPAFEKAFKFLETLNADSEEKRYEIEGERLFAIVMSYDTKLPESKNVVLESHRKYVDIQMVLVGAEGIDCYNTGELSSTGPYDVVKDVVFYHRAGVTVPAHVDVGVGDFCVLYPEDAHSPQLAVDGEIKKIKKVVVKVAVENELSCGS